MMFQAAENIHIRSFLKSKDKGYFKKVLSIWLKFFALVIHFVYIKHPPFSGKHSSGN